MAGLLQDMLRVLMAETLLLALHAVLNSQSLHAVPHGD